MKITAPQICTTGQEVEQGKVYTYVEIPVKGENYTADVEILSVSGEEVFSIKVKVVSSSSDYLPNGFCWALQADSRSNINKEDLGGTWQLIDKENSH